MYNYIPITLFSGGGLHQRDNFISMMREDQRMGSFG